MRCTHNSSHKITPDICLPSDTTLLQHLPLALGENVLLEDEVDGPARFAEAVPKQDRELPRLAEGALNGTAFPPLRRNLFQAKVTPHARVMVTLRIRPHLHVPLPV